MELISKQIAIETILGQPPELHYPSWYAAQIEKLPPAPPEYLAEQAGILATDADTISRAKAIGYRPHSQGALGGGGKSHRLGILGLCVVLSARRDVVEIIGA